METGNRLPRILKIFPVEEKFQNKKDQYDSLITQLKLLQEEMDIAMLLISQKNRYGPKGTIPMKFFPARNCFVEE